MHPDIGIPIDACTALLIRIQRGDEGAFTELYEQERQVLFLLLFKQLGGREPTEALLRELFTGVWIDSHRFDPEFSSGRAWLCSLARDLLVGGDSQDADLHHS